MVAVPVDHPASHLTVSGILLGFRIGLGLQINPDP